MPRHLCYSIEFYKLCEQKSGYTYRSSLQTDVSDYSHLLQPHASLEDCSPTPCSEAFQELQLTEAPQLRPTLNVR